MEIRKKTARPKKRSVYLIFLFSYVSILLLTLSSGFFYYLRVSDQISAQTEVTKQLLLNELRGGVETSTAYVEALTNQIVFNQKILQYVKGFPAPGVQEIMAALSPGERVDDILIDDFLYVQATDEIITPTIRMKSEQFFRFMLPIEGLDYEDFRAQFLDGVHFQQYLPIAQVSYDAQTIQTLPFIQTIPVSRKQEPLGQVVCLLNADKIFSVVEQLRQTTGSDIYILDQAGKTILTSQGAPPLDPAILTESGDVLNTDDAVILKQVSDTLGWRFIISTPKSLYYAENREFLLSIALIAGVYLAVGLVLVHFLTERSYRPIREIGRLIAGEKAPGGNEFEAIKTTLLTQMRSDKELHSIIEAQRPAVRRELLFRLLEGDVTNLGELPARLNAAGLRFASELFLVILAEADTKSPFFAGESGEVEKSLPLARLILQNVGCELLEEHFDCYYLETGAANCVFLAVARGDASPEEGASLSAAARDAATRLLRFAAQNFQLGAFVGISVLHCGLRELPVCYDEARKAADYHRLRAAESEPHPVEFTQLEDLDADYYFPAEMEYRLVGALKAGETSRAKQLLDAVLDLNTRQKKIGPQAARRLLFDIGSTLQKLVDSTRIAQGKGRAAKADLDKYWRSPDLQAARAEFFDIIDQFAAQRAEGGKTARLANAIAAYIRDHIGDASLDLNELSREFEVTPQYISSIFKRYKQENVKEMISKLRLERAKELLRTTDLPVREIAARLGYAGEIGVIRLFKKYEGITPGDYRSATGKVRKSGPDGEN